MKSILMKLARYEFLARLIFRCPSSVFSCSWA